MYWIKGWKIGDRENTHGVCGLTSSKSTTMSTGLSHTHPTASDRGGALHAKKEPEE
jgi:hypothetical protein